MELLYSGHQQFVTHNEVSLTKGLPVGVVLCNQAVEHNLAVFRALISLTVHWWGRPSITGNSTSDLTSTGIVDNLVEKVDECPLNLR